MRQLLPLAFQVSSNVAPDFSAKVASELFLRPRRHPISDKELKLLENSKVETLQSGRKVYFWDENVGGPLITLVHGWESRGSAFYRWIPLLVEQGFRVMAWDGPAHGQSPGKRTTAAHIAKALAQDLYELNMPIYGVVGHSLGGVVVGLLARHITLPPKVVILSAPSRISEVFARFYDQLKLSKASRRHFERLIENEVGFSMEDGSLLFNDISQESQTLLIHDIDDREVPFADFKELQTAWKNARFVATQGLGHRRILRDMTVGYQIADFLKTP